MPVVYTIEYVSFYTINAWNNFQRGKEKLKKYNIKIAHDENT